MPAHTELLALQLVLAIEIANAQDPDGVVLAQEDVLYLLGGCSPQQALEAIELAVALKLLRVEWLESKKN